MAKRKRKHSKTWAGKKMLKKVGTIGTTGIMLVPAALPVAKFGQGLAAGKTVQGSIDDALIPMGLSTSPATVNWGQAFKYGMFAGGCVALGMALRYAIKRA